MWNDMENMEEIQVVMWKDIENIEETQVEHYFLLFFPNRFIETMAQNLLC
jgi:hypothetical protein